MSRGRERNRLDREMSLQTIAQILDYAILEAADLSLPMVVYLLRMALMEIDKKGVRSAAAESDH